MNARRPDSAAPLTQARRVVVKVGSALLVDGDSGRVNRAWLETLVEDLLRLRRRGQRVILVSSGAIALGRRRLGLKHGALRLEESQAAAAVGQIRLAHAYKELLEGCDVTVAQVLLTLDDSENRRRYLNARATLEALLELDALPVINENDTVATAEIRYGDNDRLATRVAQMAGADCTWFVPTATPAAARKQWIAGTLRPAGAISIDAGAERALLDGRSLLPAGVTGARGRFDRGDTVSVLAADGAEIARGIVAYSDVDAARIMGRKSSEIAEILGFRGRDEMIHRDDLVLMRPELSSAAAAAPAAQPSP